MWVRTAIHPTPGVVRRFCEPEVVSTLVWLARNGTTIVQTFAVSLLAIMLAYDEESASMVYGQLEVVVLLSMAATNGNHEKRSWAMKVLARLVENQVCRDAVVRSNGLTIISQMLHASDEDCLESAVKAIAHIAQKPSGGLEPIIGTLGRSVGFLTSVHSEEVKVGSARVLGNMVSHSFAARSTVKEKGGFGGLVAGVRSSRRALKIAACEAIKSLAFEVESFTVPREVVEVLASKGLDAGPSGEMVRQIEALEMDNSQKEKGPATSGSGLDTDHFTCPISHEIMMDPVVAPDGYTYERSAIQAWFENHSTSPMTNEHLTSNSVTPNDAMKTLIETCRDQPGGC